MCVSLPDILLNNRYMTRSCKNLMPLLCLLAVAAGGCRRSDSAFTIEGNLKNVAKNELYLIGLQKPFDRIDTLRLEKGAFRYEAETDTLLPLMLLFNRDKTLFFFAEKGATVTVEGDALLPDSVRISGGEANEELNRFRERIRGRDSLRIMAEADSFIRSHPFSQASVYLLDRCFVQSFRPDVRRIDTLTGTLSGMLHDHPFIRSLQKKIENAVKADTGRYVSNFRMKNRKGENLTSYRFRDKVLVVCFWATWDSLSVKRREELKALRKKLKKEEAEFVYFSLDMDRTRWEEAVKNDTLDGEHAFDGEGWESPVVKQFGVERLPLAVVLSPQRKVAAKSADTEAVDSCVRALLKQEKERKNKLKKR